MGDTTGIEWTDSTWNPTVGCTKVSPGCDHCYAETFVNRFAGSKGFPLPFDQMHLREPRFLHLPNRWKEPRRIFVNSLSDLFHDDVPDEFICRVFDVMLACQRHTFQLLTKRHARMRSFVTKYLSGGFATEPLDTHPLIYTVDNPPPNVWLGVSVEEQKWADIRIPALLDTPAAVRWVSAEPLLGPLNLRRYLGQPSGLEGDWTRLLDWIVVGGESGPGARPMHPDWACEIRNQCAIGQTAFLFKQWGNWASFPDERAKGTDLCLYYDGSSVELEEAQTIKGAAFMRNVGKKAAGRHLDGITHDGYPLVRV